MQLLQAREVRCDGRYEAIRFESNRPSVTPERGPEAGGRCSARMDAIGLEVETSGAHRMFWGIFFQPMIQADPCCHLGLSVSMFFQLATDVPISAGLCDWCT